MSFGGDPTVGGWVVTVAYVAAAGYVGTRARYTTDARRNVLVLIALSLLALGLNKQLDLHEAAFVAAREAVRSLGWDAHKRALQLAGVGLVLAVGGVGGLVLRAVSRRVGGWPRSFHLAALVFVAFAALRVAAFVGLLRGLAWLEEVVLVAIELGVVALVVRGAREWTGSTDSRVGA
jgi:hypothetical protein